MSNPTSNFGWQMPTATDLVTDLPADFEVFGQAVDTDLADLNGGTTGQILSKTSATDLDFTWIDANAGDITGVTAGTGISGGGTSGTVTVTNSMATAFTTSGDLIQATGSGTFARLGTGTTGQYLTTNGTTNSWGTISVGGMTLISTTTLSGASTTISSIPGTYKNLQVIIRSLRPNTDSTHLLMRVNGDSTASRYRSTGATDSSVLSFDSDSWTQMYNIDDTATQGIARMDFYDYANTSTWKLVKAVWAFCAGSDPAVIAFTNYNLLYNQTSAISSITLFPATGTWNGGSVLLYGVN